MPTLPNGVSYEVNAQGIPIVPAGMSVDQFSQLLHEQQNPKRVPANAYNAEQVAKLINDTRLSGNDALAMAMYYGFQGVSGGMEQGFRPADVVTAMKNLMGHDEEKSWFSKYANNGGSAIGLFDPFTGKYSYKDPNSSGGYTEGVLSGYDPSRFSKYGYGDTATMPTLDVYRKMVAGIYPGQQVDQSDIDRMYYEMQKGNMTGLSPGAVSGGTSINQLANPTGAAPGVRDGNPTQAGAPTGPATYNPRAGATPDPTQAAPTSGTPYQPPASGTVRPGGSVPPATGTHPGAPGGSINPAPGAPGAVPGGSSGPPGSSGGPGTFTPPATPAYNGVTRPESTLTPWDFFNDQGYQYALEEGTKGIENSAAARGALMSGNTMKELTRMKTGEASKYYGEAYDRYNQDRNIREGQYQYDRNTGRSDYVSDRDFDFGKALKTYDVNNENFWKKLGFDEDQRRWITNFDFNAGKDARDYQTELDKWNKTFGYGVDKSDREFQTNTLMELARLGLGASGTDANLAARLAEIFGSNNLTGAGAEGSAGVGGAASITKLVEAILKGLNNNATINNFVPYGGD